MPLMGVMMSVYVANFGRDNYEWPECLARGTIATVNEDVLFPLWREGEREAYVRTAMEQVKGASGKSPTRAVASRWYNLMTIISESVGDVWVHRDGSKIWWTKSIDQQPEFYERTEPVPPYQGVVVCHKPCEPWLSASLDGRPLMWDATHPKAKAFLTTTATLQRLTADNADYVMALIRGEPLDAWHSLPAWKAKLAESKNKTGGAKVYGGLDKCVWRMADTAFHTTQYANGQTVAKVVKNKDCDFDSKTALEDYIREVIRVQDGQCAITGFKLNYDDPTEDDEMRASLDRIDSSGHYSKGNLQVVCRFVNRWKGADDNAGFKRLIDMLMNG